jgi:hypothetical protein
MYVQVFKYITVLILVIKRVTKHYAEATTWSTGPQGNDLRKTKPTVWIVLVLRQCLEIRINQNYL